MTTTTGRTKTEGDADPTGPLPPICLQSQVWLPADYTTDPVFPRQGAVPRYYPQGRGYP